MKKGIALFLATVLMLSMMAGCGSTSAPKAESSSVSNEPTVSDKKIELTMWDVRTEGPAAVMIDKINAEFTKVNPNITVKRSAFKVDDLRNTIKPAINSGKGPDIFSYDAGAGYLGVLADSGLALDMTKYADQFGWKDRFHDWALEKTIYNDKMYGIANELEVLGVYYNKKLFADAGVNPPKTYDEFLEVCKTFKEKGITPVVLDDKDQWPGFHLESMWLNSLVGPDKVKEAVANKAAWNRPEFGIAMDKLYELVKLGYTTEKPLGVSSEDNNLVFFSGKGAMRPTGTWLAGNAVEKMGDNVGFFYLPSASSDIPLAAPGGLGEAVVVNGKTKNADAAMKYVDFLFSKDMVKIWYEAGFIPSLKDVDYSSFKLSALFKTIVDEINNATDLGVNIDVVMPPKVNDVTMNYVQELLAGKKSGQECMDQKEKTFKDEIAAGSYKP